MDKTDNETIRILVADDEDKILDMYREIFEQGKKDTAIDDQISQMESQLFGEVKPKVEAGPQYDLTLCRQGDEAVEMVRKSLEEDQPYAMAVLDVRMPPGPNGVWTAEQIRKMDEDVNILIVTGYSDYEPEVISERVPPADKLLYVHKPLHPTETRAFAAAITAKWILERKQRDIHDRLEELVEERNIKLIETNKRLEEEIAARKYDQMALSKSEHYLKTLLNTIRCGMLVINGQNDLIIDANPFALELMGAELENDVIGCPSTRFLHPDSDVSPTGLGQGYTVEHTESTLHTLQGKTLNILKSVATLDDAGESFLIVCFIDITAHKIAEHEKEQLGEQLRQAQKMEAIGLLAGGTAHDFNNLLQAILGHADLAMDRLPKPSAVQESIEQVRAAGLRAADLVRHILTFSRQNKPEYQPVLIQQVIEDTLKLIRATVPTTIQIEVDVDSVCPPVTADWTELQQILINLCTNAQQAMLREGGTLSIKLTQTVIDPAQSPNQVDLKCDRYAHLTISDTGSGMQKETVSRIFEPYFTTKEKGKGTGLGLATVYGIVKSMDGAITVMSEPGKGSTFDVFLPLAHETKEAPAPPVKDTEDVNGTETILFVDDEELLVDLGVKKLPQYGYTVDGYTSSKEAFEVFKANPDRYDLIVTDQTMPGYSGDQLARKCLEIKPEQAIILCTGFSETVDEEIALDMGIRAYLRKPITLKDLAASIRTVMSQPVSSG